MSILSLAPPSMLVVAPHADDEVLGAGGLMALASQSAWHVYVLFATVAGYRSLTSGGQSSDRQRREEMEAALAMLGAAGHEVLFANGLHHLRLDTVPQTELITFVEHGLAAVHPSVAVVPSAHHFHQDHRAVADACLAALRPAPGGAGHGVQAVLAYGHPMAGWGRPAASFAPNVFVDIGSVLESKLAALECYQSQVCESPHPRSLDAVRDAAAFWGSLAGVKYAEPFECLRLIES